MSKGMSEDTNTRKKTEIILAWHSKILSWVNTVRIERKVEKKERIEKIVIEFVTNWL